MSLDYNSKALEWECMQRFNPASRHRRRIIINLMNGMSFKSVHEVGCGRGIMLDTIGQDYDVSLSGSDISGKVILKNRKDLPNMCFYKLDIRKESLPKMFDCVIASELIEHLMDFEKAILNLVKMTKRYLIITVPSCPLFQSDKNLQS